MTTPWNTFLDRFPSEQRKLVMTEVARMNGTLAFGGTPLLLRIYAARLLFGASREAASREGLTLGDLQAAIDAADAFVKDWWSRAPRLGELHE